MDTKKLANKFEENPMAFLAVGAAFMTGFAKLVDAAAHARGSNAYAKQVNHRVKKK